MADLKHLKVKPQYELEANDPLAELTRITGFQPQNVGQDHDLEDFGIDLERELLGEFGADDPVESGTTPVQPVAQATAGSDQPSAAALQEPTAGFEAAPVSSDPVSASAEAATPREPSRPPLRIVTPVRGEAVAHEYADAALERELSAADDAADQPVASVGAAEEEYADPLDQLEAFSRDWFARRQAMADPQDAAEGHAAPEVDEVDFHANEPEHAELAGAGEPAGPEAEQAAPIAYMPLPDDRRDDEPAAREAVHEDGEATNDAAPAAGETFSWDMQAGDGVAEHREPVQSEEPAFDPFAELSAMSVRPPDEAYGAQADRFGRPTHSDAPAAETNMAGSWEAAEIAASSSDQPFDADAFDLDFDFDPQSSDVAAAEPANRPASQWWDGTAADQPSDDPSSRQEATSSHWAQDDAAHGDVPQEHTQQSALPTAGDAVPEDDFDLGRMLEDELAAEAARFAGAGHAVAHDGYRVSAEPPHAIHPEYRAPNQEEPEVDTVEVPVSNLDVADDLDIPELVFEDEPRAARETDELDIDFASAFEELGTPQHDRSAAAPAAAAAASYLASQYPYAAPPERSADVDAFYPETAAAADHGYEEARGSWEDTGAQDEFAHAEGYPAEEWRDDVHSRPEGDVVASAFYEGHDAADSDAAKPRRRGLVVAAVVAAVAGIGGIGAFALSYGDGSGGGEPALVSVDPTPIKVRPEKPGGTIIPNQDKAVYDRAASGGENAPPAQERLVSTREEPIDMAARIAPATEGQAEAAEAVRAKSEDRVEQELEQALTSPNDDIVAIAPRRVRTMVVKPDGTLVPREEPVVTAVEEQPQAAAEPVAREAVATQPAETAAPSDEGENVAAATAEGENVATATAEATDNSASETSTATAEATDDTASETSTAETAVVEADPVQPAPVGTATETASADTQAAAAQPAAAATETDVADTAPVRVVESQTFTRDGSTPARGPVAPTRPSDQPVEIVGSAGGNAQRPTQVAAAQPAAAQPAAAAAAPASEWTMQIASQPSPEGAQKSYVDLAQRYGSILGGRGVNIVKADIAGKGTFWRVRIPADSRSEAVQLCERYKSAGGSCFVAK